MTRSGLLMLALSLFRGASSLVQGWTHQHFHRRCGDGVQCFGVSNDLHETSSRREVLSWIAGSAIPVLFRPSISLAEETTETVAPTTTIGQQVSTDRLATLLRAVPTFAIVDKRGVPYMVVGEDAKVTGYFFTEYDEAKRILSVAKKSADKAIREAKKDPEQSTDDLINPWLDARISTIPLDFATTLVSKTSFGAGSSRRAGGNYFQVAPSEKDVADALSITGKDDLTEGKVPLFYFEDFELRNGEQPLYFSKTQLVKAFQKERPGEKVPEVKVTELFAVLLEMVRPDGSDPDLQKLMFVPPLDSIKMAQKCLKDLDNQFTVGQRNIVL